MERLQYVIHIFYEAHEVPGCGRVLPSCNSLVCRAKDLE